MDVFNMLIILFRTISTCNTRCIRYSHLYKLSFNVILNFLKIMKYQSIFIYIYIYIYLYVFICLYIFIYIYMYLYVYIYPYIHLFLFLNLTLINTNTMYAYQCPQMLLILCSKAVLIINVIFNIQNI